MYFESRFNRINNLSNASITEQSNNIKKLSIGQAVKIKNLIWVNDENPSGTGIKEVAVLYQLNTKTIQFESITVDKCSQLRIENYIKQYSDFTILKDEYNIEKRSAIRFNDKEAMNWFNCGCCGTGFKSTIKYQQQFDQDAGYGICSDCE